MCKELLDDRSPVDADSDNVKAQAKTPEANIKTVTKKSDTIIIIGGHLQVVKKQASQTNNLCRCKLIPSTRLISHNPQVTENIKDSITAQKNQENLDASHFHFLSC